MKAPAYRRRPGELQLGDVVQLCRPEVDYHGIRGRVYLLGGGDSRVGVVWWFPQFASDFYAVVPRAFVRRVRGKGGQHVRVH